MSTTNTDNQMLGIFGCHEKFREHTKLYEKAYSAPDVVEHLRTTLFNLARTLDLVTFLDIKSTNTKIEEQFRLVNDDYTLTVAFNGYGQLTPYLAQVKNPCTFLNYNKHIASLSRDMVSQSKEGMLEFLNSLTYLHRRDYAFNCDYDDGCFDICFESQKNRFNIEVNITLN